MVGANLGGRELQDNTWLSLLFAAGARPSAGDIERLIESAGPGSPAVHVGHRPPDIDGRLELLVSGLTLDLAGLAPAPALSAPPVGHVYGLPDDVARFGFEAVSLAPGPHIDAGAAMMPVIRILLGLAADLAVKLPSTAVCWRPACSWMEPKYFARRIVDWLSGGAFPALGLTGLTRRADGAMESLGLAFFTGQEVVVKASANESLADAVQLTGRVIDQLVRHGRLDWPQRIELPELEDLMATPSPDGTFVEVVKQAR